MWACGGGRPQPTPKKKKTRGRRRSRATGRRKKNNHPNPKVLPEPPPLHGVERPPAYTLCSPLLTRSPPISQPVPVVLQLPVRNPADLDALLSRQADPTSPDYRKWLSPSEFEARFGASAADVAAATASLQTAGFTVSKIGPNTLVARGAPTDVEAAFNTTLVTETVHVPAQAGVAPLNGSVVGGAPVSPAPADSATTTVLKAAQPLQPLVGLNLPPGTTATGPPIVGLPTFRAGAVVRPWPPVKEGEAPGGSNGYVSKYKTYAYWGADLRQAYKAPALSTGITGAGRTVCNLMAGDFLDR